MKLANGSGSIICLDKTGKKRRKPWAVRITAGWQDGKQQRKYIGYYATQADAIVALAEYHKNHIDFDVSKLTLDDVYQRWTRQIEKNVSASVLENHRMCYLRLGSLAKKQIRSIKTTHLQDWMDNVPLKPSTKGKLKSTLSQLFAFAESNDMVQKNYAKHIVVHGKIEKSGAIFTTEELKTLWDNSHLEAVQDVLILVYTGMRIGEALSIRKETINLEERYMIGGSKSEAGRDRVIPIHKAILPFIEERYNRGKYLIYNRTNDVLSYSGMKERYRTLMKKFEMNHKIHDTRKTAVSLMHSSGIQMEVIRIIVGHSGKGVTESVYLFKEASELVEAIDKMNIYA
jgi:integrase